MLRREGAVEWERERTTWRQRPTGRFLLVKTLKRSRDVLAAVDEANYRVIITEQETAPVPVIKRQRKILWQHQDEFYWADDNVTIIEVALLITERLQKQLRRLQRAAAISQTTADVGPSRQAIPDDVKRFVWQRDGGKCVACGTNERLEFDHIIPLRARRK